jgi:hypothetical protein
MKYQVKAKASINAKRSAVITKQKHTHSNDEERNFTKNDAKKEKKMHDQCIIEIIHHFYLAWCRDDTIGG